MTTIALLTDRQELLAFLALAGEGDIPSGSSEHDCIIMGVPESPELFDHPLGNFLQSLKLEELRCNAHDSGARLEMRVVMPQGTIFLEFADQPFGRWHYVLGEHTSESGLCAFADGEL